MLIERFGQFAKDVIIVDSEAAKRLQFALGQLTIEQRRDMEIRSPGTLQAVTDFVVEINRLHSED